MLTPSLAAVRPRGFPYGHRDAAWRLARGVSRREVARAGRMREADLAALLADPRFAQLVRACADGGGDRARWRERLVRIAYGLLEEAMLRGDFRAARFVVHESTRGRDPGESVVDAVERAAARGERALAGEAAGDEDSVPEAVPAEQAAPRVPASASRRLAASASRDRCHFRDAAIAEDLASAGLPAPPSGPAPRKREAAKSTADEPAPPTPAEEPSGRPEPPIIEASPGQPPHPPPRMGLSGRGTCSTAESPTTKTLPTPEHPPGPRQRDGP